MKIQSRKIGRKVYLCFPAEAIEMLLFESLKRNPSKRDQLLQLARDILRFSYKNAVKDPPDYLITAKIFNYLKESIDNVI